MPKAMRCAVIAFAVLGQVGGLQAAGEFPISVTLDAQASNGTTSVTSKLTVRVDRLMEESRWKRVSDALKFDGYPAFFNVLRTLPAIGSVALQERSVPIRYAREQMDGTSRRLILVADRPLFFLGDQPKGRAGYELTIVDLRVDGQGNVSGTMMGAARVKPSPDGVVVDDYATAPVQLKGRLTPS